jgi:DNA-binding transcriptional ArsR family regulator
MNRINFLSARKDDFRNNESGTIRFYGGSYSDPRFKRVLYSLIAGTLGGITRAKIVDLINIAPANANQISLVLKIDYKTVMHHIQVLIKNGLVITDSEGLYGATYLLTPIMENNYKVFHEIMTRIEKN